MKPTPDFDPLAYFPGGNGTVYDPNTGALTYYLRGTQLEIGNPIWVKSLGQYGIIVSDCACNAGSMGPWMTNNILGDAANYILPHEAGYGAQT